MSVLESIRQKTGLLVGIVGVAIVIFILESLLSSNFSFFGGNENLVGVINGKKIDAQAYQAKYQELLSNYSKNNPGAPVDDNFKSQAQEQVWNTYFNENMMLGQYEKAGIVVSDDEIYDMTMVHPSATFKSFISDRQTGKVVEALADANGELDKAKWQNFIKNASPEQLAAITNIETGLKETRVNEKYNALIKKGLYVTNAQAKLDNDNNVKSLNAKMVLKRFETINDSTVKVSDDDLQKYFNAHQYLYYNADDTRKIEYVTFDANPTPEDIKAIETDCQKIAEDFKIKKGADDSVFVMTENESGAADFAYFKKGTMNSAIDSIVPKSTVGTVFGPYLDNNAYKISKLVGTKLAADSGKVRHLLIATKPNDPKGKVKTKEQAKKIADSLFAQIKSGKLTFDSALVVNTSEDPGSKSNGGDYGWITEATGFVAPFKKFALEKELGALDIVETEFGYHIMKVIGRGKSVSTKYQLASITKSIEPSTNTIQTVYQTASQFSGNNRTKEAFDKAILDGKLNKKISEDFKLADKFLPGLESPRDLIKWAFEAKVGDISQAYTFGKKNVVAILVSEKEKGKAKLADVKTQVEIKAKQAKKAEMLTADFNTKAGSAASVEDIAAKLGAQVERLDNVTFNGYTLPNLGKDDKLTGKLFALKVNTLSPVIISDMGVSRIFVEKVTPAPALKDINQVKKSVAMNLQTRVDYEVYNALKEKADITDKRAKFDF
jgi:peptidyl-prolyl cis-trans isomerase D